FFKLRDFDRRDARLLGMHVLRLGGENRAEIEQFVLHAPENRSQPRHGLRSRNASHPGEGVQFIDRAITLDAQGVLGHALPAGQMRLALVAGLGVDAIQRDTRLVEFMVGHGLLSHSPAYEAPMLRSWLVLFPQPSPKPRRWQPLGFQYSMSV